MLFFQDRAMVLDMSQNFEAILWHPFLDNMSGYFTEKIMFGAVQQIHGFVAFPL